MKIGCLAIILTMVGVFGAYHQLLAETKLAEMWWISVLLGIGAGMIVGNIHGLILALKQKRASSRQRSEWQDGDLVVISGKIQTLRSPIIAPFSGTPSVIVEYDIKTPQGSDSPSVSDYNGFMMAPCSVLSTQGSVNILGFPLLAKVNAVTCPEEADYQRAGEFLKRTTFQERPSNPVKLLKQVTEVISKNDGEIQAHFSSNRILLDLGVEGASSVADQLKAMGATLEEVIVPSGAEVTISGTYRANRQAVEIGGGLNNLSHTLDIGTAAAVTGKNIRQCFIWLIIIGGAFGAGNYFLLKELGLLSRFGMQ